MKNEMQGRVCMVTGATSGLGRVTARALARQGATTIVVGRNEQKCAATVDEIREETGNGDVAYLLADLSSLEQVRALARTFQSQYGALHVLVNNAGGIFMERAETADGFEWTFGVNHLAPFLLTNLLLDRLIASAPARIVNVASWAQAFGRIDFDDLQGERRFLGHRAYTQSKLANVLFTYELARRLAGTGVTANAVNPGVVDTCFGRDTQGVAMLFRRVIYSFATTPEQGARTLIYLATSPEVADVSGKYFANCKPGRSSRASYDREAARRLWDVSERLAGLAQDHTGVA
jgi:retinol dehydrogenase-14